MNNFDKSIPFDPGFSKLSFSFVENIEYAKHDFLRLKAPHQKKFWLMNTETKIVDFINKTTAFYLGCILWGGLVHFRFNNPPREISDNTAATLTEDEKKNIDCSVEVKSVLEYIESFDKDCKYFLKRSSKLSPFIKEVLNSYIEFAQINENFVNVRKTDDIKIPQSIKHFENLSKQELDSLCEKIYKTIEARKIEDLLDVGFYKK